MNRDAFLRRLWQMDRALVSAGFHETSPWWKSEIERFIRSCKRRWVIRAGRRAGKSSTLARLAVAQALYGEWSVPPGDVAVVAFISVSKDEAMARLRTIGDILDALGIRYERRGEEIEILGRRRIMFKVLACTAQAVVGFTSIAIFADEAAMWESRDSYANPAKEVLGALFPTTATQPFAFSVISSSPWSFDDYHCELFDLGDDEHQITSFAESWVANPTLTREQTHALEPDGRAWARAYAAIPSAAVAGAFSSDAIDAAFRPRPDGYIASQPILVIDWSSGKGDSATAAVIGMLVPPSAPRVKTHRIYARIPGRPGEGRWIDVPDNDPKGRRIPLENPPPVLPPLVCVHEIDGIDGKFWDTLPADQLAERFAELAHRFRCTLVVGDSYSDFGIAPHFEGLEFKGLAWSATTKPPAVRDVQALLRERRIILPEHERLRRELGAYQEILRPSGTVQYSAHGRGHDDYVSLLITFMMAQTAGLVPATPRSTNDAYWAQRQITFESMDRLYADEVGPEEPVISAWLNSGTGGKAGFPMKYHADGRITTGAKGR